MFCGQDAASFFEIFVLFLRFDLTIARLQFGVFSMEMPSLVSMVTNYYSTRTARDRLPLPTVMRFLYR